MLVQKVDAGDCVCVFVCVRARVQALTIVLFVRCEKQGRDLVHSFLDASCTACTVLSVQAQTQKGQRE